MGRNPQIDLDVVSETAGLAGRDHLFSLADTVLRQNGGEALELIDGLHKVPRICSAVRGAYRAFQEFNVVKNHEEPPEPDRGFSG